MGINQRKNMITKGKVPEEDALQSLHLEEDAVIFYSLFNDDPLARSTVQSDLKLDKALSLRIRSQ